MKSRWVFVVGMYRTGSTTQYRMAEEIVQSTENGVGIGYHTENRLVAFDEGEAPQMGKQIVVCKVFIYLPETSPKGAEFLRDHRIMAIGSVRDPRDVFISMRERRRTSGQDVEQEYYDQTVHVDFPKWFAQFNQWVKSVPAHVSRFEDFTTNPLPEVKKLANFLRIPLSQQDAVTIASKYTTSALKAEQARNKQDKPEREHPMLPSIPGIVFGTTGHWRNFLTEKQGQEIYQETKTYMDTWGFKP